MTRLSADGTQVVVTDRQDVIAHCKMVGQTSASSSAGGVFRGGGVESSLNQMRNQAGSFGGDTLYLMHISSGWSGSDMLGQAYLCGGQNAH